VTVEGCGSDSLQGDVRFAEVMGLMGATVEWAPYSITITGAPAPHLGLLRWRASERPGKRNASCTGSISGYDLSLQEAPVQKRLSLAVASA